MKILVSALEHSANVHLKSLKKELDADTEFMEYLNTLKPRSYHKAVIERLLSLIDGENVFKDQYRRNAADLYHKNLVALSKV